MENTERYQIILSAQAEVEDLSVNLDAEDLSALEQLINQQLQDTDNIGQEAGAKLAEGLEEGAAQALDLRGVLQKVRAILAGEVKELAKEELVALKAALEHLGRAQLSEAAVQRTNQALLGLSKLAEAAEKGYAVSVKVNYNAFSPEEVERQAKAFAEAFQRKARQYFGRYGMADPGMLSMAAKQAEWLYKEALQTPGTDLKRLQTLQEALQKEGVSTEVARMLNSLRILYENSTPGAEQKLTPIILARRGIADTDVWGNTLIRGTSQLVREARSYLENSMGLTAEKARKLIGTFGQVANQNLRLHELQEPRKFYDKFVEAALSYEEADDKGKKRFLGAAPFSDTFAARIAYEAGLTQHFMSQAASIMAMEKEAEALKSLPNQNTAAKARLRYLMQILQTQKKEFNALAGEVFEGIEDPYTYFSQVLKSKLKDQNGDNLLEVLAKTVAESKGPSAKVRQVTESVLKAVEELPLPEILKSAPKVKTSAQTLFTDSKVYLLDEKTAEAIKRGYLTHMRVDNVYRTPIRDLIEVDNIKLLDLKDERGKRQKTIWGDGTIGRVKPEMLGLPKDFTGVVQVRAVFRNEEGIPVTLGKGTVLVHPKAENEFNVGDLYANEPGYDELLKAYQEGKLKVQLGVVDYPELSPAEFGKQGLIRHTKGFAPIPYSATVVDAEKIKNALSATAEAKLLPLAASGEISLFNTTLIPSLASSGNKLSGKEGLGTFIASHKALKGLDDDLYELLDKGVFVDEEGALVVPAAIGRDMARQLGLKPGNVALSWRNPMMGHKGGLIKVMVSKVVDGLRGIVFNERGLVSTGADFDGDRMALMRQLAYVQPEDAEVVSALMALSGLLGGRKGGEVGGAERVYEDVLKALDEEAFKAKHQQFLERVLGPEELGLEGDDLWNVLSKDNPWANLYHLSQYEDKTAYKRYAGFLRKELGGQVEKERLEAFIKDARRYFGRDPRKFYKQVPIGPAAEFIADLLSKEFALEADKEEYHTDKDPVALAVGQLTASNIGMAESMAQQLESVLDLDTFAQLVKAYNRASSEEERRQLEEQLTSFVRNPVVRAWGAQNILYQVLTDRQKRDWFLRINGEAYRDLVKFTQLSSESVPPDSQTEEARRAATLKILGITDQEVAKKYGLDLSKKFSPLPTPTKLTDLAGLTPKVKKGQRPPLPLVQAITRLHRGIYDSEALIGGNLPHEEVQKRLLAFRNDLASYLEDLTSGNVVGYEDRQEEILASLIPAYTSALDMVNATIKSTAKGQLLSNLFFNNKALRTKLIAAAGGTEKAVDILDDFAEALHQLPSDTKAKLDPLKVLDEVLQKHNLSLKDLKLTNAERKSLLAKLKPVVKDHDVSYLEGLSMTGALRLNVDLQVDEQKPLPEWAKQDAELVQLVSKVAPLSTHEYWANVEPKKAVNILKQKLEDMPAERRVEIGRALASNIRSADVLLRVLPQEVVAEALHSRQVADQEYKGKTLVDYLRLRSKARAERMGFIPSLGFVKQNGVLTNADWYPVGLGFMAPGTFSADPNKGRFKVELVVPESVSVQQELVKNVGKYAMRLQARELPAEGLPPGAKRYEVAGHGVPLNPLSLSKDLNLILRSLLSFGDDPKKVSQDFAHLQEAFARQNAQSIRQLGLELRGLAEGEVPNLEGLVEELTKLAETVEASLPVTVEAEPLKEALVKAKVGTLEYLKELALRDGEKFLQEFSTALVEADELTLERMGQLVSGLEEKNLKAKALAIYNQERSRRGLETKPSREVVQPPLFDFEELKARVEEVQARTEEKAKALDQEAKEELIVGERTLGRTPANMEMLNQKLKTLRAQFGAALKQGYGPSLEEILKQMRSEAAKLEGELAKYWERQIAHYERTLQVAKERTVKTKAPRAAAGGGGAGQTPPPPPQPPAPPPDGGDDDRRQERRRKRAVHALAGMYYRPQIRPIEMDEAKRLKLLDKEEKLIVSRYKGLVRSRAEEEFLKGIFYNAQVGKQGMDFTQFALEYPELLNTFFGPIRSFAGRETFTNKKVIEALSGILDQMVEAYAKNDVDALVQLTEDLNIRAKAMEVGAKQLADLREFKRSGTLPYSRNLHTGSEDALFYKRMFSIGGKELDRAIEEGDLDTIIKIADRARHVGERIKLVQNALSNSLAFMFSSLAMNLFGQVQQQFMEMDRQAKAVAALANMSGNTNIGQRIAQASHALGAGMEEITQALVALDKQGLDPGLAAKVMQNLKGILHATGESVGDLAGLYQELAKMGGLDPTKAIKETVRRGLYLSQARELIASAGIRRDDVRNERQLSQVLLALEAYQAQGIPVVLPSQAEARRRKLEELVREGAQRERQLRREGKIPAKTALEPTALEKLGEQAKSTIQAIIQAAKPALDLFGGILMTLLKIAEAIANTLNNPFGRVLVLAGSIYATLLAIMQLQKTFQVASWIQGMLQGLKELNAELLVYLRNLKQVFADRNLPNNLYAFFGGLVDAAKSVFSKKSLDEVFGKFLSRFDDIFKGLAGKAWNLFDRFFKPGPVGIVANASLFNLPRLPKFGGVGLLGAGLALTGAVYQMNNYDQMGLAGNLLSALGQGLLISPLGKTPIGLLVGGLLTFGVPAISRFINERRSMNAADRELERVLKLSGGVEGLADALNGQLTPALEKAGYTAESLQKVVEAAANSGSKKFRGLAKEVQETAEAIAEAEKRFAGLSEYARERYDLYQTYFTRYAPDVYLPMTRSSAELINRIFPDLLKEVSPQELLLKDVGAWMERPMVEISGSQNTQSSAAYRRNFLREVFYGDQLMDYERQDALLRERLRDERTKRLLFKRMAEGESLYGVNDLSTSNLLFRIFMQNSLLSSTFSRFSGATLGAGLGAMLGSALPVVGTAVGGLVGGALGFFGGEGLYRFLANRYARELGIYTLTRKPTPAEVAALSGAAAVSDIRATLTEELKTEGIREIPDTVALSRLTGEKRIKAVKAVKDALQNLAEAQQQALEVQRELMTLKQLGISVDYGVDSTTIRSGALSVYRLRSRVPELEGRLASLYETPKTLAAMYRRELDIQQREDGTFIVRMKENTELARQAMQNVTSALKELGVQIERTKDELASVRFDELVRNMVARGEEAFVKGMAGAGQAWLSLMGFSLPKNPILGFFEQFKELEMQKVDASSAVPLGLEDLGRAILGREARLTAKPGDKGPMWRMAQGHDGVDYAAPAGTPVRWGNKTGIVYAVEEYRGDSRKQPYGNSVVVYLPETGELVRFAHLKEAPKLKPKQVLSPGQVIGFVGSTGNSTGPHLHVGVTDMQGRPKRDRVASVLADLYGSAQPSGSELVGMMNQFLERHNLQETYAKYFGEFLANKASAEQKGVGMALEKVLQEGKKQVEKFLKDQSTQVGIGWLARTLGVNYKTAEENVRNALYAQLGLFQLEKELKEAQVRAREHERNRQISEAELMNLNRLYAADPTARAVKVQLERARSEYQLGLQNVEKERQKALEELEAERQTSKYSVEEYEQRKQAIEAKFKRDREELTAKYRTSVFTALLEETNRVLEREVAALPSEEAKLRKKLETYKQFLTKYAKVAPKEIIANVNEMIADLEAQLLRLGKFSKLREAEVRDAIYQLVFGSQLPNRSLDVLKLAESIYNDNQLTEAQKRTLGVNPNAKGLDDLLLQGGLLDQLYKVTQSGDAFGRQVIKRLDAYQRKLLSREMDATAYLLESPLHLLEAILKDKAAMREGLLKRKRQELEAVGKQFGLTVEEAADLFTNLVMGNAIKTARELYRASQRNALTLKQLSAGIAGLLGEASTDYQQMALDMEARLKELAQSVMEGEGPEKQKQMEEAQAFAQRLKANAPLMDAFVSQYASLNREFAERGLEGNRLVEALLNLARSENKLPTDLRSLLFSRLNLRPEVLERQLVYARADRLTEASRFRASVLDAESETSIYRTYGFRESFNRSVALAQLRRVQQEREARQRAQDMLTSFRRSIPNMSEGELLSYAQVLGVKTDGMNRAQLEKAVYGAYSGSVNRLVEAQVQAANNAFKEAVIQSARAILQSRDYSSLMQVLESEYLPEIRQALSPRERIQLNRYLKNKEGYRQAGNYLEAMSRTIGLEDLPTAPAELVQLVGKDPVLAEEIKSMVLELAPELAEALQSDNSYVRLKALEELVEWMEAKGLGAAVKKEKTEIARIRLSYRYEDWQREMEQLEEPTTGGLRALLEWEVQQRERMANWIATQLGVSAEELLGASAETLEQLAAERQHEGITPEILRNAQNTLRQQDRRIRELRKRKDLLDQLAPSDRLLAEYSRLGYELPGLSLEDREKRLQGIQTSMSDELAKLLGRPVSPEEILKMTDNELKEAFNIGDEVAQQVRQLASALDELGRTLQNLKLDRLILALTHDLRKAEAELEKANLGASTQELAELRAKVFKETEDSILKLLEGTGISIDELYLEPTELMSKHGLQGEDIERRIAKAKELYSAYRNAQVAAYTDAIKRITPSDNAKDIFKQAYEYAKQYRIVAETTTFEAFIQAFAQADPNTTLGQFREALLNSGHLTKLVNGIILETYSKFNEALVSGDYKSISDQIRSMVPENFRNYDVGSLVALANQGVIQFSTLEDRMRFNQLVGMYSNAFQRRMSLMQNEISNRYEAYAPIFNSPLSAAKLEILKLQEMYNRIKAERDTTEDSNLKTQLTEELTKIEQELRDASQRYGMLIVREWNRLLGDILDATKSAVADSLKVLLKNFILDERGKQLREIDQKYSEEVDFSESELEEARRQKAIYEEKLRKGGLDTAELEEAKRLYDYYTEKVAEMEDRVKRIRFEWERAKQEVKTIGELIGDILNRLADALLDRFVGFMADMLFDSLKAGLLPSVSGGVSTSGTGGTATTPSTSGTAPTAPGSGGASPPLTPQSSSSKPQSSSTGQVPASAGSQPLIPPGVAQGISYGLGGFSLGMKTGEDDNWALEGVKGVGLAAGQAGLMALLGGAGLEGALGAAAGVLLNPIAWIGILGGAAIGAYISSNARADEFNRKHAGSTTYGVYNPAERLRRGAHLSVNVHVNAKNDPDEIAKQSQKAIADSLRKKEYSGGLTDI